MPFFLFIVLLSFTFILPEALIADNSDPLDFSDFMEEKPKKKKIKKKPKYKKKKFKKKSKRKKKRVPKKKDEDSPIQFEFEIDPEEKKKIYNPDSPAGPTEKEGDSSEMNLGDDSSDGEMEMGGGDEMGLGGGGFDSHFEEEAPVEGRYKGFFAQEVQVDLPTKSQNGEAKLASFSKGFLELGAKKADLSFLVSGEFIWAVHKYGDEAAKTFKFDDVYNLREAFGQNKLGEKGQIKFGKTFLVWGINDLNSPINNFLMPVDNFFGPNLDLKLPFRSQLLSEMIFEGESFNFKLALMPFFTNNRTATWGSDWSLPIQSGFGSLFKVPSESEHDIQRGFSGLDEPNESFKNFSGASQFGYEKGNFSFDIGAGIGFSRNPMIDFDIEKFQQLAALQADVKNANIKENLSDIKAKNEEANKLLAELEKEGILNPPSGDFKTNPNEWLQYLGKLNKNLDRIKSLQKILNDPSLNQKLAQIGSLSEKFEDLDVDLSLPLKLEYKRELAFWTQFSFLFEPFILRTEAIYSLAKTYYSNQEKIYSFSLPVLELSVELEYQFQSEHIFLLAFNSSFIRNAPAKYGLYGQETVKRPKVARTVNPINLGFTYTFNSLDSDWGWLLGFQMGLRFKEYVLSSKVNYKVAESHKISLGSLILEGPKESIFGGFDHNDFIFFQYELGF